MADEKSSLMVRLMRLTRPIENCILVAPQSAIGEEPSPPIKDPKRLTRLFPLDNTTKIYNRRRYLGISS